MDDPYYQSMMEQMLDDPDTLKQIMEENPMTRQLMNQNPMMKTIMSNPAMMKMFFSIFFILFQTKTRLRWQKKCRKMVVSTLKHSRIIQTC